MTKNKNEKNNADRLKGEFYKGMKESKGEIDKLKELIEILTKKTDAQIRQITDGFGKFAEGLVEPNVAPLFKQFGIEITGTSPRVKRHYNGEEMEVDILATGRMNEKENAIIFVEVKTDPTQRDIKDEIKHIEDFYKFFSEYKEYKVIGAIAGIKITKGVKEYAEKCGFYVLAPSGDTMVILNKKGFKPKIFKMKG